MAQEACFQFEGFRIIKTLIERKNDDKIESFDIDIAPNGIKKTKGSNGLFELILVVKITDKQKKVFELEITSVGSFLYSVSTKIEELENYLYINAPAILFPYIRAYISTLTNLSGFDPINLPTLNMVKIGELLKNNIREE